MPDLAFMVMVRLGVACPMVVLVLVNSGYQASGHSISGRPRFILITSGPQTFSLQRGGLREYERA